MSSEAATHEPDPNETFITQVMELQRSLYAFILSLTHVLTEADDVLQEVNLVLWRKREEYSPGSDFRAWAFRIARFQVLAWRKRQSRERLHFSDDVLEQLASEASPEAVHDRRRTALAGCMQALRDRERGLLEKRYSEGLSTAELARLDGRTVDGIYSALARAHRRLADCVRRKLAAEDRAG